MKKRLMVIFCLTLLGCNQGVWVTPYSFRPKKAKYAVLKRPFQANSLIDYQHLYISAKPFLNFDSTLIDEVIGFYKDGRLIVDIRKEKNSVVIRQPENSIEKACYGGYYTTDNGNITLEYFVPSDQGFRMGEYLKKKGIIKKDTIILINYVATRSILLQKRYDTLVRSDYSLK